MTLPEAPRFTTLTLLKFDEQVKNGAVVIALSPLKMGRAKELPEN